MSRVVNSKQHICALNHSYPGFAKIMQAHRDSLSLEQQNRTAVVRTVYSQGVSACSSVINALRCAVESSKAQLGYACLYQGGEDDSL